MTLDDAARTIRAEMANAKTLQAKSFWKGVLVGLGCGANLNFNVELMKDLANRQGMQTEPIAEDLVAARYLNFR